MTTNPDGTVALTKEELAGIVVRSVYVARLIEPAHIPEKEAWSTVYGGSNPGAVSHWIAEEIMRREGFHETIEEVAEYHRQRDAEGWE